MPSEDDPLVRANARVGRVLCGNGARLGIGGVASVDAASRHGRGERSS
jgi:hypothetical protein